MFRLKKTSAAFEIVDGPLAGRKYLPGQTYAEIPPEHRDRFELAGQQANPDSAEPAPGAEGGKKR